MKSLLAYAKAYLMAYIVAPIVGLFNTGYGSILADLSRFDAKIDRFLDREALRRTELMAERDRLRDQIDTLWADHDTSEEVSMRAGRIQDRIREIIQ